MWSFLFLHVPVFSLGWGRGAGGGFLLANLELGGNIAVELGLGQRISGSFQHTSTQEFLECPSLEIKVP